MMSLREFLNYKIDKHNKNIERLVENSVKYDYSINEYNRRYLQILKTFNMELLFIKQRLDKVKSIENTKLKKLINTILKENEKDFKRIEGIR